MEPNMEGLEEYEIPSKLPINRDNLENLLTRRFFFCQSFSIYGGVKGLYDYGPPGCAIKSNILSIWRQHFILEENMLEIDTSCVTPRVVFQHSGHLEKFTDLMVKDLQTGIPFRADHLLEDAMEKLIEKEQDPSKADVYKAIKGKADSYSPAELDDLFKEYKIKSPETGNDLSSPFPFNLMFHTQIGPTGQSEGFLRPETAQGIFVNFARLVEFNGGKVPFAAATIGSAFRNEISPRAGLLRVREFTLAEVEHFVNPENKAHPKFDDLRDYEMTFFPQHQQETSLKVVKMSIGEAVKRGIVDNETLGYYIARTHKFLILIGVHADKLRFRQHMKDEKAHYARDCWDAEILTSYGWVECVGIADRACYDLSAHQNGSGKDLSYFEVYEGGPREVEEVEMKLIKNIIGKTFGKTQKQLVDYLEKLSDSQITSLKSSLQSSSVKVKVGEAEYEVTPQMIEFKVVKKRKMGQKVTPSVIEPSFGIGRIPLGDDFRYVTAEEAEAQFRNYQMIFDYINSTPSLNAEAKFGTLDDYFQTLREEADRINYSVPREIGSGQISGFPSLSGDFFTYADRQKDYWSGYYVSRPFFKAVDRVLEQTLRASEMLMAFLLGHCQRPQCEELPMRYAYKLTAARRNLALFQHHDGVTGTAKDHVVLDYGTRMHTSLQDLQIFMSKAIEVLLGIRQEKYDQTPALFDPEQVRSKYDALPMHRAISARKGTVQSVVLFNPLEQTREEVVMVVVSRPDVSVLDSNWTCVQSQVSPELQHDESKIFTGRHRIHWKASIPAMGLQTYYIANGFAGCEKAKPAKLKFSSKLSSGPCVAPYACSKVEGDTVEIVNRHQVLTFDVKHGLLQKVIHKNGLQNVVVEEIALYSSSGGAYLFLPDGDAQPIIKSGGNLVISEGPLMQEVYSYPKTSWEKTPVSHSTRIYNGGNTVQDFLIEKEYHVELLGKDFNDRELIVRYKTDTNNKRIFYSDLNGFQMSRRETYDKIPLQGNYYPMPSLAFMQGSNGQRFSIHSRQALGAASLKEGWLEIMLDRRLVRDDGRGLGQGVMDNRVMNVVFHILMESNISSTSDPVSNPFPLSPSLLSHRVNAQLNYPLHAFIAKKPQEISAPTHSRSFSPLAAPLPCDLHIVSFKVPRPSKYSQQQQQLVDPRLVLMLHRRNWDSSYCKKARSQCTAVADESVNLFNMFKDLTVLNARATSLNLLHDDTEMLGYTEQFGDVARDGRVIIPPMEIQAYKFELRPRQ